MRTNQQIQEGKLLKWKVVDLFNKTGDIELLAEYVMCLARGSRESHEEITPLEKQLEQAAFFWLKNNSTKLDKTSKALALNDDDLLTVTSVSRGRDVQLSDKIEAAELAAFMRSRNK